MSKPTNFAVDQKVVYSSQGVGIIRAIEKRPFNNEDLFYYVIYIEASDMTIMAPVEKAEELGIRATVSRDDAMSEQEQQEAADLARRILDRINDGEEIGVLAAQYSDDPGSRFEDGEYTFGRGMMVPEFEQWSFESQSGDTGIVSTMFGYHVMQKISGVDEQLDQLARQNIFRQQYSWLYETLDSEDWVINQEVLDRFAAML